MRLSVFAAAIFTCLLWGTPPFAWSQPDSDEDGVHGGIDNCSDDPNPSQDDTDADDCGNLCDADYNNNGVVDFLDFGTLIQNFGCRSAACELFQHVEPIGGGSAVGFLDFGFLITSFGRTPGPSGTTTGTPACP